MRVYRGKCVGSEKWVEGDLVTLHYPKMLCIATAGTSQNWCNTRFFEVVPETVGQYTGLKDKNGKEDELYHKDIVLVAFHKEKYGLIEWIDDGWAVVDRDGEYICSVWDYVYNCCRGKQGNIHENPDLLKE